MAGLGAEVNQKIKSAIKAKLMELGVYVDEELPDYIMVMVINKRSREQMEEDLQLFLGTNTAEFTNWLHQVLKKLQEVTVIMERKRKSSTNESDGESCKKDKHKKSAERKKFKKSDEQTKDKEDNSVKTNECASEVSSELVINEDTVTEIQEVSQQVNISEKTSEEVDEASQQSTEKPKIVLMQSDDDDDDFINIKADAEAEALLEAELPKEAEETYSIDSPSTEDKQHTQTVEVPEKVRGKGSLMDRLGTRRVTAISHDLPPSKYRSPLVRVTDRLGDKVTNRTGIRKVRALKSYGENSEGKISSRLGTKINFPEDTHNVSVTHTSPAGLHKLTKSTTLKSNAELRTLRRPMAEEDNSNKEQSLRKLPVLSRVVALNKEEEEYDPTNPAVGSVASIVRVKPRPKVPAALQANKNLILKAMAEAQKSVANAPKRIEPEERADGLFTKKFRDSKGRDKIAVKLPNRKMHPREKSPGNEKSEIERIVIPVKLEATRSISSVNLQQKIVIQVSADNTQKTTDREFSKFDDLPQEEEDDEVDEMDTKLSITEGIPKTDTEELKDEGFEEIQRVIPCISKDPELEAEQSEESCHETPLSLTHISRTESPQFVVTLDGLDPTIFSTRKKQKAPTVIMNSPNSEPVYKEKERQDIEEEKPIEKRPASPIVFKKATSDDTGVSADALKQKVNERCKYWPVCRSGDKCDYLHPTVPCKSFPSCKFGDKCLYIHPNCKFDASCTRRDCPFTHASPRTLSSVVVPVTRSTQQVCKFFPKCSNVNCRFMHPKMCRYGRFCNRKTECNFRHEEIPSTDKLKWICPFRL